MNIPGLEFGEFVELTELTTFKLPFTTRYFKAIQSVADLRVAFDFAAQQNIPLSEVFVLGSGSNILKNQTQHHNGLVLKMEIPGFEVMQESEEEVLVKIGAGEVWDSVVERTVSQGLSGIEALSAIPGTAGATPIQNVGAYGREIKDVLVELEAYEVATGLVRTFTNADCGFGYRDSIFKRELAGQYVITSIILKLSKQQPAVPDYRGVREFFDQAGVVDPTLLQIRDAIIAIRSVKLPDPKELASVGSFFKNPFVSKSHFLQLQKQFPGIVAFPSAGGHYKISAGWLLETLGYKGKQIGNLQFYPNNALVLVNKSHATFAEVMSLVEGVQAEVKENFGIELELEPLMV